MPLVGNEIAPPPATLRSIRAMRRFLRKLKRNRHGRSASARLAFAGFNRRRDGAWDGLDAPLYASSSTPLEGLTHMPEELPLPGASPNIIELSLVGQCRFNELKSHPPPPTEAIRALGALGGFNVRARDIPNGVSPSDFRDLLAIVKWLVPSKNFPAPEWLMNWLSRPIPALGGLTPLETLKQPGGKERVVRVLKCMGSGAYL